MKERMLRDIEVSEVGMGCMAFSHGYGQIPPEKYSIEAIRNTPSIKVQRSGSVPPVLHRRLFAGRDRGDEGRAAEHGIQEAPQDQEAADGDVQESSIRQTRVFLTEYGAIWRREFFLPLLMIEY